MAYDINNVGIIYIAFYFDGLWRQDDIPHVGVDTITHWMPLPKPPKPKEPSFKDKFLEAFPKANYDLIVEALCVRAFFPQFDVGKKGCLSEICEQCWNQPYFEAKEEGGEE